MLRVVLGGPVSPPAALRAQVESQGTVLPSHLSVSLSLQAPAEGEAKEEVGVVCGPHSKNSRGVLQK